MPFSPQPICWFYCNIWVQPMNDLRLETKQNIKVSDYEDDANENELKDETKKKECCWWGKKKKKVKKTTKRDPFLWRRNIITNFWYVYNAYSACALVLWAGVMVLFLHHNPYATDVWPLRREVESKQWQINNPKWTVKTRKESCPCSFNRT